MPTHEKAEIICARFAPLVAESLRYEGRTYLSWSDDHSGLHITVGSREVKDGEVDLSVPPEVRKARPSYRAVYKVLVELRAEVGAVARIMPSHVASRQQANFDRDEVLEFASIDTVKHALADLDKRGAVHWARGAGWLVGASPAPQFRQPSLDFGPGEIVPARTGHDSGTCRPAEIAHASRVARDSRESLTGDHLMRVKRFIWVPGEKSEFAPGGLIVTDARTEQTTFAEGATERMRYEGKLRKVYTDAVRGELVRVDESGRTRYAVVKITTPEGKKQIAIRVLGDWHLDGQLTDTEELASISAN